MIKLCFVTFIFRLTFQFARYRLLSLWKFIIN